MEPKYDYLEETKKFIDLGIIQKTDVFDFDLSPCIATYQQFFDFCYENLLERNKEFNISPAIFFYKNQYGINARATRYNGHYAISMNMDVVPTMYAQFHNCYNPTHEPFSIYELLHTKGKTSIPYLMFQTSLLFLYYHELAHLIQFSSLEDSSISENYEAEIDNTPDSVRKRHILEMDADIFATHQIYGHALQYWKELSPSEQNETNLKQILVVVFAGVYLLFMNLQGGQKELYYEAYDHPHPDIRISYIFSYFIEHANTITDGYLKSVEPTLLKEIFTLINGFTQEPHNSAKVVNFAKAIVANQAEIEAYVNGLMGEAEGMKCLVRNQNIAS